MSAAKKKKKNKKAKKLRVETTNNVLSAKEIEKRDKAKLEENNVVINGEEIPKETIEETEANESIKNLIKASEELENGEPQVQEPQNEVDKINNIAELSKQLKQENIEDTKIVPSISEAKTEEEKKQNEKPEYVKQMIASKRKQTYIFVCIVAIILIAILMSTVFAIMDSGSSTMSKGITIKNFDVSGLTKDEAKDVISKGIEKELIPAINIKYNNDYETDFNPDQIEFNYDIDSAIEEAYNIGKAGNIVENNYSILFTNIFGKKVDLAYSYNEELLNNLIDEINSNIPGVVVEPAYYIEEDELIVNKGIDGLTIDKDLLKEQIINDLLDRNALEMKDDSFSQEIELKVFQTQAEKIDMQKIYNEIYTEPKDAYYEAEPYKLYPDVDGVNLAISVQEAQNQVDSKNSDEYKFKLNITKANKTVKDLGLEAFPYLISEFSTKYDASNINRSTNLAIAANKINGTVVMPGEEFSYNKVVGKRTVEEGYKDAKVYQDGGVVDGLAGGICQISSTLYNAVLLANLEIVERHNHTYTTSYLPAGRDATVVWGTKDFKFKNTRNYPVKIEASVKNGIAEFKFHGIAEETEYEIKIIPVVTSSIPFATVYEDDPTLAPGKEIVKQGGHSGCRATTYKEVRLNGNVISKDIITTDTYSPMKKIIRRGPVVPVPEVIQ